MLRFLVLGIIPGTTIQLNLVDISLLFLTFVASLELYNLHRQHLKDSKNQNPKSLKRRTAE